MYNFGQPQKLSDAVGDRGGNHTQVKLKKKNF